MAIRSHFYNAAIRDIERGSRMINKVKYTKADVAATMESVFAELRHLRNEGQKEYAHADDRPFRNFEDLAYELSHTREEILWIYMRKHMDGIKAYIKGHRSQREDVRGRINDALVYLILLRAMIEEADGNIPCPPSYSSGGYEGEDGS
jgi:hypothetical protein